MREAWQAHHQRLRAVHARLASEHRAQRSTVAGLRQGRGRERKGANRQPRNLGTWVFQRQRLATVRAAFLRLDRGSKAAASGAGTGRGEGHPLSGRCSGITRQGARCERSADSPNGLCWLHDPTRSEDRRRAASKAGRSKPNAEITNVKAGLYDLISGVLDGSMERAPAAVAVQAYNVLIRCLEVQRKIAEQDDLLARIAEFFSRSRQGMEARDHGGHRGQNPQIGGRSRAATRGRRSETRQRTARPRVPAALPCPGVSTPRVGRQAAAGAAGPPGFWTAR